MNRLHIDRKGFTLIELLVVIAIIAILLALLLPAVQKVRGAAARLQCQNNLKQLGIAMHGYANSNKTLPSNGLYTFNGTTVTQVSPWSAMARLLPYVEQDNIYKDINFSVSYGSQVGVSSKRIPLFVCPSEVNDRGVGTDPVYGNKHWIIDYAVNQGTWAVLLKKSTGLVDGDGAFSSTGGYRLAAFSDGTSNTLAMAEVKAFTPRISGSSVTFASQLPPPNGPGSGPPFGVSGLTAGAYDPNRFTHVEWVDGKVHETGFTTTFTPNTYVGYASNGGTHDVDYVSAGESSAGDTYAAVTARSYHSGMVNVLLMDGSVRNVADNISLNTWRALGTRMGGEVLGNDF